MKIKSTFCSLLLALALGFVSCGSEIDECACRCLTTNGVEGDVTFENENWLTNSDCDRHVGESCVIPNQGSGTVTSCD